jgi:hypothetical protein
MLPIYKGERDEMEAQFLSEAEELEGETAEKRSEFMAQCFAQADQALDRWSEQVAETAESNKLPKGYRKLWRKLTKASGYNFGFRKDFTSSPTG